MQHVLLGRRAVAVAERRVVGGERELVHVEYSEGAKLFQQTGRSGSTLTSVLRALITNDTIGEDLVDKKKSRKLLGDDYVMSVIVGFQPEMAAPLFVPEEVAAGTPQRFVFSHVQLRDPRLARDVPHVEEMPHPVWRRVPIPIGYFGAVVMFCDEAMHEVAAMRDERSVFGYQGDELDAHEPLVLMKVAADLAMFLDEVLRVSPPHWDLAKMIYARSRAVRSYTVERILAAGNLKLNKQAEAHATRTVAAEIKSAGVKSSALESWVNSAARAIRHHADDPGSRPDGHPDDGCPNSCVRGATSGQRRALVDDVEAVHEAVVERGLAVRRGKGRKSRWLPGPTAPVDGRTM